MKILITGNLGYVGLVVAAQLRRSYPGATVIGFETEYFDHELTNSNIIIDQRLYAPSPGILAQHFGYVEKFPEELFKGVDILIQLADTDAVSVICLAAKAKDAGVQAFIYPGRAVDDLAEELAMLADANFQVRILQYGIACGMSNQLHLEPILNDFVATSVLAGEIYVPGDANHCLSLIHVKDLSRAISWAVKPEPATSQSFLNIRVGSDAWTYRRCELAIAVGEVIPGTLVFCTDLAQEQCRSEFSFEEFKVLAPKHQPRYTLKQTILELYAALLENGIDRDTANRICVLS